MEVNVDNTNVTYLEVEYGNGFTYIYDNQALTGDKRMLDSSERLFVLNKDVTVIKVKNTPWNFRKGNIIYFFRVNFDSLNKHIIDTNAYNDLNNQSELNKLVLVPFYYIFEFDLSQWGLLDLGNFITN